MPSLNPHLGTLITSEAIFTQHSNFYTRHTGTVLEAQITEDVGQDKLSASEHLECHPAALRGYGQHGVGQHITHDWTVNPCTDRV